jgi:hypothetical protein
VGQLVHQHQVCTAVDHGLDVELSEGNSSVERVAWGYHFQVSELGAGLGPTVTLDPSHDDPLAAIPTAPTFGQHGVGLAHSGGDPQVRA